MKCSTYFLIWALSASSLLGTTIGKPIPQAASVSSTLLEFDAAPAPTSPIGGPGDFVSIDSATKLFKVGGKPQKFVGMRSKHLIELHGTRLYFNRYEYLVACLYKGQCRHRQSSSQNREGKFAFLSLFLATKYSLLSSLGFQSHEPGVSVKPTMPRVPRTTSFRSSKGESSY